MYLQCRRFASPHGGDSKQHLQRFMNQQVSESIPVSSFSGKSVSPLKRLAAHS